MICGNELFEVSVGVLLFLLGVGDVDAVFSSCKAGVFKDVPSSFENRLTMVSRGCTCFGNCLE